MKATQYVSLTQLDGVEWSCASSHRSNAVVPRVAGRAGHRASRRLCFCFQVSCARIFAGCPTRYICELLLGKDWSRLRIPKPPDPPLTSETQYTYLYDSYAN